MTPLRRVYWAAIHNAEARVFTALYLGPRR